MCFGVMLAGSRVSSSDSIVSSDLRTRLLTEAAGGLLDSLLAVVIDVSTAPVPAGFLHNNSLFLHTTYTILNVTGIERIVLLCVHLSTGSRSTNALNINSFHLPTKFSQPANLTIYTILSLYSLRVEPAPHLLSP